MIAVEILIYLTIFLSPLYVIRWHYGSIPTTLLETLIISTIVLWFAVKVYRRIKHTENFFCLPAAISKTSFVLPLALFLFAAIASTVMSSDKRGAFGIFKAYIVEPLLFYIVFTDVIHTSRQLFKAVWALILSGLWLAYLGFFQYFTGYNPFAPQEAVQGRITAVYNSANALALYLGPIVAVALSLWLLTVLRKESFKEQIIEKINAIVITIFLLLAIWLTRSAGAMVGIIGVFMFFGWEILKHALAERKKVILRRAAVGFLLFMFACGTLFLIALPRFTPNVSERPITRQFQDTGTIRLCLWEGTRNMLLTRPIFGAGLNGFRYRYDQFLTCDPELLQYPHNIILTFWSETGFLGLIAFGWIVWKFFRSEKRKDKNLSRAESRDGKKLDWVGSKTELLLIGLQAAMVYILIHGMVDVPYFKNDLSFEFWILVGLMTVVSRVKADVT